MERIHLSASDVRCAFSSLSLTSPQSETIAWRAVVRVLRSTVDSLASVVFPSNCRACGMLLAEFQRLPICTDCLQQLTPQTGLLCECCGERLEPDAFELRSRPGSEMLCPLCREVPPKFSRAVAFGLYEDALRSMIHLLKYEGLAAASRPLGRRLAGTIVDLYRDLPIDARAETIVTSVPLFARKRRQRGFNQAQLLAGETVGALRRLLPDWPLAEDHNLLRRVRETETQATLNPHQRRKNLRGAFALTPGAEERIRGRHVLLIDDIYTTGTTARLCSEVLRNAGAYAVYVATVARSQRHGFVLWDPAATTDAASFMKAGAELVLEQRAEQ